MAHGHGVGRSLRIDRLTRISKNVYLFLHRYMHHYAAVNPFFRFAYLFSKYHLLVMNVKLSGENETDLKFHVYHRKLSFGDQSF